MIDLNYTIQSINFYTTELEQLQSNNNKTGILHLAVDESNGSRTFQCKPIPSYTDSTINNSKLLESYTKISTLFSRTPSSPLLPEHHELEELTLSIKSRATVLSEYIKDIKNEFENLENLNTEKQDAIFNSLEGLSQTLEKLVHPKHGILTNYSQNPLFKKITDEYKELLGKTHQTLGSFRNKLDFIKIPMEEPVLSNQSIEIQDALKSWLFVSTKDLSTGSYTGENYIANNGKRYFAPRAFNTDTGRTTISLNKKNLFNTQNSDNSTISEDEKKAKKDSIYEEIWSTFSPKASSESICEAYFIAALTTQTSQADIQSILWSRYHNNYLVKDSGIGSCSVYEDKVKREVEIRLKQVYEIIDSSKGLSYGYDYCELSITTSTQELAEASRSYIEYLANNPDSNEKPETSYWLNSMQTTLKLSSAEKHLNSEQCEMLMNKD